MASDSSKIAACFALMIALTWSTSAKAQSEPSAPPAPAEPGLAAPGDESRTSPPAAEEVAPPAPLPIAPPPAPTVPLATSAPAPVQRRTPPPRQTSGIGLGFEVGYGWAADDDNLFGNGLGRTVVLRMSSIEIRFLEDYDLEDRSGMYEGVGGAQGQLGISSVGHRIGLARVGSVEMRGLVGAAWLRRPSLRYDPDEISSSYELRRQHGLGAMLGVGPALRAGRLALSADLRIYPTWWSGLEGSRAVVREDVVVTEEIMESPGGIPTTLTIAIHIEF